VLLTENNSGLRVCASNYVSVLKLDKMANYIPCGVSKFRPSSFVNEIGDGIVEFDRPICEIVVLMIIVFVLYNILLIYCPRQLFEIRLLLIC